MKAYELTYMQDCCGERSEVTHSYTLSLADAKEWARTKDNSFHEVTLDQDEAWKL